jgi:hypothetical protein
MNPGTSFIAKEAQALGTSRRCRPTAEQLGLDLALELFVQALDRVGGASAAPLRGGRHFCCNLLRPGDNPGGFFATRFDRLAVLTR